MALKLKRKLQFAFISLILIVGTIFLTKKITLYRCTLQYEKIRAELVKPVACQADLDCGTLSGECPFGCKVNIVPQKDIQKFIAQIKEYHSACGRCVYDCMFQKGKVRCLSGKCEFVNQE